MSWTKKILASLITSFIIFTVIIFSFEGLLKYYLGLGKPVVYEPHNLWGYSPKSNSKYTRFKEKYEITINDVGLRSKANWNQQSKKILFLGDSVTYGGSYLNDEQTFSHQVCKKLANYYCFNGGVNGYGILNMVARSKHDKRIASADVVVFTFITADFDRGLNKSDTAHFVLREPPKFLPAIWEILNFIAAKIQPKFWFGKKNIDKKDTKKKLEEIYVTRQFALDIFISEIERLISLNKVVLLVYSPSIGEIKNINKPDNNIVDKLVSKFPNNLIILKSNFELVAESDLYRLFRDNVHYDYLGHKFISEIISEKLGLLLN